MPRGKRSRSEFEKGRNRSRSRTPSLDEEDSSNNVNRNTSTVLGSSISWLTFFTGPRLTPRAEAASESQTPAEQTMNISDFKVDKDNFILLFKVAEKYEIHDLKVDVLNFASKIEIDLSWPKELLVQRDEHIRSDLIRTKYEKHETMKAYHGNMERMYRKVDQLLDQVDSNKK